MRLYGGRQFQSLLRSLPAYISHYPVRVLPPTPSFSRCPRHSPEAGSGYCACALHSLLGIEVPEANAFLFLLPKEELQTPWCTACRRRGGGGGLKEEEGAGGRRRGGRGPGPGVREAVVEGGGGSG